MWAAQLAVWVRGTGSLALAACLGICCVFVVYGCESLYWPLTGRYEPVKESHKTVKGTNRTTSTIILCIVL